MSVAERYRSREHWDSVHRSGESRAESGAVVAVVRSAQSLVTRLNRSGDRVVVDLACGTGALLNDLPSNLFRVGIDFSYHAVRRARTARHGRVPGIGWLQAEAGQVPLRDGCADVVTLMSAWWVLPNLDRCLAETARILRPGGRLVVHLWGPASSCRLITVGAAAVAAHLPALRRPTGVLGPFEADSDAVRTRTAAVGMTTVADHWYELTWPVPEDGWIEGYWYELTELAPTAATAYRSADAATRAAVDRSVRGLVDRLTADGPRVLGLQWHLVVLQKPGLCR